MEMTKLSCEKFLAELAGKAPTPGGGGASAYCGALACALASMVGNLTVGKKTYAQVEPEVYMRLEKLAALSRSAKSMGSSRSLP